MRIVAAVLLMFSVAPILHACSTPEKAASKLELRQDGNDVIVSTTVTSSGIGHLVLTSYEIDAKNHATLKYTLIQSEEQTRLERLCLASIKVEWRLKGVKLGDITFKIQGKTLEFSLAELQQLRDQLNKQFAPRPEALRS